MRILKNIEKSVLNPGILKDAMLFFFLCCCNDPYVYTLFNMLNNTLSASEVCIVFSSLATAP